MFKIWIVGVDETSTYWHWLWELHHWLWWSLAHTRSPSFTFWWLLLHFSLYGKLLVLLLCSFLALLTVVLDRGIISIILWLDRTVEYRAHDGSVDAGEWCRNRLTHWMLRRWNTAVQMFSSRDIILAICNCFYKVILLCPRSNPLVTGRVISVEFISTLQILVKMYVLTGRIHGHELSRELIIEDACSRSRWIAEKHDFDPFSTRRRTGERCQSWASVDFCRFLGMGFYPRPSLLPSWLSTYIYIDDPWTFGLKLSSKERMRKSCHLHIKSVSSLSLSPSPLHFLLVLHYDEDEMHSRDV